MTNSQPTESEPDEPEIDWDARFQAEREHITKRFEAFPEEARGLYVMMLRSHAITLAARCPLLQDRRHESLA